MNRLRIVGLPLAALLLVSSGVEAQAWKGRGRLEGKVTDPAGKPIGGAEVKLRLAKGGDAGPPAFKADEKGRWAYMGLGGGEWTIDFDAAGFVPGRIVVNVSEVTRTPFLEYKLEAAKAAEPDKPATTGLPPEIVEAVKQGNAALDEKRWADARAAFEKAATGLPESVPLLFALGRAYSGEGNAAKAIETIRKITDKEPANNGAWLLLASLELEKGNLEGGQAALAKVPDDFVKDPNVFINIGVLFMNKKKPLDAETYFTKAIAVAPAAHDGYYYRGLARVSADKKADAKADFKKVLEIAPASEEAKEAKQLIQALP